MPGTRKHSSAEDGDSNPKTDPESDGWSQAETSREDRRRTPEYLSYLEKASNAMRTIRLIVYAGMASFIVLAFYGFFLIYQLTTDVHLAVEHMLVMTQHMSSMTEHISNLDGSVSAMEKSVSKIDGNVAAMNRETREIGHTIALMQGSVGKMGNHVGTMSQDLRQIGETVSLMQHSARNLDQAIGPMMGTVNRMVPFGWPGSNYGGAPPFALPMR